MCASRIVKAGAVLSFFGIVFGYQVVTDRYGIRLPDTLELGVLAILFVALGLTLMGIDMLRWRRMAHSLGLERMEDASKIPALNPLEAYEGKHRGRKVMLDFHNHQDSGLHDRSRVLAPYEGKVDVSLVVRRQGVGGMPTSELPPEVTVDSALIDNFNVYSSHPGFAREVLDPQVQEAISDLQEARELSLEGGYAVAESQGRILDADTVRRQMEVVCALAETVESAKTKGTENRS